MAVSLLLFATIGSLLQMAAASLPSQNFFQAVPPQPAVLENGNGESAYAWVGGQLLTWSAALVALTLATAVTEQFRQFQVGQPLTLPKAAKQCAVEILQRNFANSYYCPEIVDYV